jgi:hypothetical protein
MINICSEDFRQLSGGGLMLPRFGAVYSDTDIVVVVNHSLLSSAPSH